MHVRFTSGPLSTELCDSGPNDVFVVPNNLWHHHVNTSLSEDAVLYSVSDRPLVEAIGQYYAQGRTPDNAVTELNNRP